MEITESAKHAPIPALIAAERANSLERALLAALVDCSDDAIVSKTLDGCIQTWNRAAERLFGYDSSEVIGKPITIIVPPELQDEEREILQRLRRGQRIDHFETVRMTKSGQRVPVSLTVSPIRDANGAVIGASKIARDISDRHRAECMLRRTQGQLEAQASGLAKLNECTARLWSCHTLQDGLEEILNAVVDLLAADKGHIQLLDEAGTVLRIAAHRGFTTDFLHQIREVRVADNSACGRALRFATRIIIDDVEADAPYGPLRPAARAADFRAVVSTPLTGPEGTAFGVLSTHFRSIHRPTEQELRLLDLFVRHACDFIRRCQMEQALRRSEESLREGDRRKDEFLALLAHELRNPLAPIRYALATIHKPTVTSAQQAKANEVIERQVAHMSHLLDDLLDVSRITRGVIELRKSQTELATVISAAVEAARPLIDAKHHELLLDLPDQTVAMEADSVRLTQVFSNLLINAAKYTDPAGTIHVRAWAKRGEVVVLIRDTGIGIPAEMMPNLFTLFNQAHCVLERSEGGLGVGLALVRGLVTLHGGRIEARSDGPHKGSEFIVHLPVAAAPTKSSTGVHRAGVRESRRGFVRPLQLSAV